MFKCVAALNAALPLFSVGSCNYAIIFLRYGISHSKFIRYISICIMTLQF